MFSSQPQSSRARLSGMVSQSIAKIKQQFKNQAYQKMKPYTFCQKGQVLSVNCEFLGVIPDITAREGSFLWRYTDQETG